MKRLSMKQVEEYARDKGLELGASYGYYQLNEPTSNGIRQLTSGTLRECYIFLQGYRQVEVTPTQAVQSLESLKVALEDTIDKHSLASVLHWIAQIGYEKSDHITTNWQDPTLARKWAKMATRIERASEECAELGV